MIIQMNKLFMTLRSMLDWTAKVFFCVFLLLILDIGVASTSDQNSMNSNTYAATIKDSERRRGPFKFGGKEYTVVLKIKKYVGTSQGFNETVESFSIVDEKGKSHYQKSFNVVFGRHEIAESTWVSGYALESCDKKFFRNESGRLVEDVMKGCVSRGIILFYSVVPSAPATGVWCQVSYCSAIPTFNDSWNHL
jgi:hypothetical protein